MFFYLLPNWSALTQKSGSPPGARQRMVAKQSKQWQWMLAIAKQYLGQTRKITSSAPPILTWRGKMKNCTSTKPVGRIEDGSSSICPDSISAGLSRDKKRKFWPFYWAIKSGITFLYVLQPTCKHSKRGLISLCSFWGSLNILVSSTSNSDNYGLLLELL